MATGDILASYGSAVEPTCNFSSITNAWGVLSAQIDNTTIKATYGYVGVQLRVGTTPTANTLFKIYLVRQTDTTNPIQDGNGFLGTSSVATNFEPVNAEMIGTIVVTNTSNITYTKVFPVYDPGEKFSIMPWNQTGVTTNSTQSSPTVQWTPVWDQVQS